MFALIQNGVVVAINKAGFENAVLGDNDKIAEGDLVVVGMSYDNGSFYDSISELSVSEKIEGLENSITHRNLRMAALGDEFAIAKLQAVESEIEKLRGGK